jgi:hypothetical protein
MLFDSNELEEVKRVSKGWREHSKAIADVRGLERPTMLTPVDERAQGYYRLPAIDGYQQLVAAFKVLDGNLTDRQQGKLDKFINIIDNLREDYKKLDSGGYEQMPSNKQLDEFVKHKMQQLEKTGEVYMLSGHRTHANIVKIQKKSDGSYSYTLYDSGHETRVVRYEGDRSIVNAVEEHRIKDGASIKQLIVADVVKMRVGYDSEQYKASKSIIENSLDAKPIRVIEDYGQRRGNCTTRGQRILIEDIVGDDPALTYKLRGFIVNDDVSVQDIQRQLAEKEQEIKSGKKPAPIQPEIKREGWQEYKSSAYGDALRSSDPFRSNGMTRIETAEMVQFSSMMKEKGVNIRWGWKGDEAFAYVPKKDVKSYSNLQHDLSAINHKINPEYNKEISVEPNRLSAVDGKYRLGFPAHATDEQIHNFMQQGGLHKNEYIIGAVRTASNGEKTRSVVPLTEKGQKAIFVGAVSNLPEYNLVGLNDEELRKARSIRTEGTNSINSSYSANKARGYVGGVGSALGIYQIIKGDEHREADIKAGGTQKAFSDGALVANGLAVTTDVADGALHLSRIANGATAVSSGLRFIPAVGAVLGVGAGALEVGAAHSAGDGFRAAEAAGATAGGTIGAIGAGVGVAAGIAAGAKAGVPFFSFGPVVGAVVTGVTALGGGMLGAWGGGVAGRELFGEDWQKNLDQEAHKVRDNNINELQKIQSKFTHNAQLIKEYGDAFNAVSDSPDSIEAKRRLTQATKSLEELQNLSQAEKYTLNNLKEAFKKDHDRISQVHIPEEQREAAQRQKQGIEKLNEAINVVNAIESMDSNSVPKIKEEAAAIAVKTAQEQAKLSVKMVSGVEHQPTEVAHTPTKSYVAVASPQTSVSATV